MEKTQEFNFRCSFCFAGQQWWRIIIAGIGIRDRSRLSANDGLSLWRSRYRCMECRRYLGKHHCYLRKTQCKYLHSRNLIRHLPHPSLQLNLHDNFSDTWYHLCGLLFFQKKVLVHMAIGSISKNCATLCHGSLFAHYGDSTRSCQLWVWWISISWSASHEYISKCCLLGRLASLSFSYYFIVFIDLCLYLVHSHTCFVLA